MTRDDYIQAIAKFPSYDFVKAYECESPTQYTYECYTNDERSRTQIINVWLREEKQDVIAISTIGDAPNNAVKLKELLMENVDGYYSRLAIFENKLVQVYKYSLEELEAKEMFFGFLEVARYADIYENKYFGGVDNR